MADGGGRLYVYDGASLAGSAATKARPEVVDLGGAARRACLAATGTAPRRPHMLFFDKANTHGIVSFVTTGHVLFLDAESLAPVGCVDVGVQAHAAVPTPDGSAVIVANQNGKLLQRIRTDYAAGAFTLEPAATVDLATCTTPSGAPCQDPALRPDNAPICPVVDRTGRFAFVTLRGGGLLVVDPDATPMRIVAEYGRSVVHPNGCGGVEAAGKMYLNSGGGTAGNPLESDLYAFDLAAFSSAANPPNIPAPTVVFSDDARGFVDSHGTTLTGRGRYLWAGDRAANRIVVVDTGTDSVVGEIALAGGVSPDPAPDLMARRPGRQPGLRRPPGAQPADRQRARRRQRGGRHPGVGVVRVEEAGRAGALRAVAPIINVTGGVERADPHGIAVRRR